MSKLDKGKLVGLLYSMNVTHVETNTCALVEYRHQRDTQALEDVGVWVTVDGERELVGRVYQNLIHNWRWKRATDTAENSIYTERLVYSSRELAIDCMVKEFLDNKCGGSVELKDDDFMIYMKETKIVQKRIVAVMGVCDPPAFVEYSVWIYNPPGKMCDKARVGNVYCKYEKWTTSSWTGIHSEKEAAVRALVNYAYDGVIQE